MAQETSPNANGELFPKNWKEQVRLYGGRKGFIRQELKRLGFWPPQPGSKYRHATAREEAELEGLYAALVEVRRPMLDQLEAIDKSIEDAQKQVRSIGNAGALALKIEALLAEARAARIERVKRERAERKIRRAQETIERAEKDRQWRSQTVPHLGREVSRGLHYDGDDAEKLAALGLPLLHTADDVARALEISTGKLAWLCYHRGAASVDHYHHFTIPKKNGGRRQISSPKPKLRAAQSWLLAEILVRVPVHEAAMAFRPALNIAHNAARHAHLPHGAGVVVRLDLKDFFPSITFKRVKGVFESLGYNEGVASLLALLCTEAPRVELTLDDTKHFVALTERFLPQGACTSPALTNILCRHLDKRLNGAALKCGFVFSRYADDLIFSAPSDKADARAMQSLAIKIIADENFELNLEKVAVMRRHRRQTVTGLVINANRNPHAPDGGPRLSRRDLRRFRAFLHQYEMLGREAMTQKLGQDAHAYAGGYLSFLHMVSPQQEAKIRAAHPWLEHWGARRDN